MGGIGILLNRNAGKRKLFQRKIDHKLAFVLGDRDSLRQTATIEEIEEVARFFKSRRIDILGIGGGDGSNHHTLTTFIRVYGETPLPKIAFLRGGTHNAHAVSIGLNGKPEKILGKIVHKYHLGYPIDSMERKVLKVIDGNDIRYGFTLGTGFLCHFYEQLQLRQAESQLKLAGFLATTVTSIVLGGGFQNGLFEPYLAEVIIADKVLPWSKHNSVSCSTMESIGMGFKPYPRANEKPDMFQAAVLRIRPRAFVRMMSSFWFGKSVDHPDVHNALSDRVVIQAQNPLSYVLDGEIYHGTNRLEILTGPKIDVLMA